MVISNKLIIYEKSLGKYNCFDKWLFKIIFFIVFNGKEYVGLIFN